MAMPTIKAVRAFTTRGGGADDHDQEGYPWIDDHIAAPMARDPEYRQSRRAFGINVLGTLVIEVEASDGTVGLGIMTAPQADAVRPAFSPLLLDEPVPVNGRMRASALDKPGFGVRLDPEVKLHRPCAVD